MKSKRSLGQRILFVCGAVAFLAACQTTTPITWQLPEGVKTERVNGYPMAFTESGNGARVVMVHGVLCDYRCMAPAQRGLSDEFRVQSVSLRHFYPESWNGSGSNFTVTQHAKDLATFIERGGAPANVVAWSYGAHVAYEVARSRPDLVRRLVLAEAPTDSLVTSEAANPNAIRQQRAAETARIFGTGNMEGGIEYAIDAINGPGAWSRAPQSSRVFIRDNAWTVVGIGRDEAPPVRCDDLRSLKVPVLVLTGQNTTPRLKEIVAAQAKCLPNSRVVTIPNSGHAMPLQNTAAFNSAVREFLK